MYYVYELVNLMGGVEHVGRTTRPKKRFYEHTGAKPDGNGQGRFYRRQDISMHVVATCTTKAEALDAEETLQIFWDLPTDREKTKQCKQPKGSKNSQSKLTEDKVREILSLDATGKFSYRELGLRFGVGKTTIGHIVNRRSWKHLEPEALS